LCFSISLNFGRFHGNGSHFEKNQPLTAQLHMTYDTAVAMETKKGGI
jgi:hypothetical protein